MSGSPNLNNLGQRRSRTRTSDKTREYNIDARIRTSHRSPFLFRWGHVPCLCKHLGRWLGDHVAIAGHTPIKSDASASEDPITPSWASLVMTRSCEKSRCARSSSWVTNTVSGLFGTSGKFWLTDGSAVALPSQCVDGPIIGEITVRADVRSRLITVLVSIGLMAGVSSCANSTPGSAVAGATSSTNQAVKQTPSTANPSPTQPAAATSAPTSAAAVPAPSGPAGAETQVTSQPGIFVGSWVGHGRQLVVEANGSAKATYRAYVFCSQNPTPPCDQMIGNQIVAGGQVTLHVEQVVTANHMSTATAVVLTSSDPKIAPGSTQTLLLNGDVISWTKFDTFCDSKAEQNGTCGA